ncbi:MAG TPA: sigma-70 family RNA polymerase sigma factor [Phycisphaerae bacterium]|nr:sigma-70 family RNA polymerase sigma factor [Phycisphaerae bacterium]
MNASLVELDFNNQDVDCRGGTETSDADLLCSMRSGDEWAYELFVRRHTGRMFAVASRFLANEHDAADAVQDAFVCAFAALDSFKGDSRVSTWLHRIVVNSCLMKLRSEKRRPSVSIDSLLPSFNADGHHAGTVRSWDPDACNRLCVEETREQVRAGIDALPDSYRTILLLRDIEGYDTEETARLLGCSTSNVKTRLHRARQALRTLLDPLFGEVPFPKEARVVEVAA